ncbi:hypothetical protein SAMN05661091_4095 [Paenibacillus uliginis N3/975]|uniref:Uncharacterized protein n=1 Tax=Paenibacillus uliginis N3/975 TaxID=1313296 RepID=A0A1X7HJY7_9BACL|nr:hypothetical protein [Paenibacillus uliginis]SMF88068.1 hypothetical protein SAMN05661091_4095 [Paenibacillus uliginis N3/975]
MSGFIPIGRELQNHWLRRDKDYWMVFCEMYFLARYSDKPEIRTIDGLEVTIHHKEFIFGRPGWSRRLDISEQRLKTLIKKLIDEGFIKQTQRHSKFTVYSFEYEPEIIQNSNQQNNQHSNQQNFSEQPAGTQAGQGISGTINQQNFSEQPAQQPAEQPMKEEGIKEEGIKEECLTDKTHKGAVDKMASKSKVEKSREGKSEYAESVWLKPEEHEKLLNEFGQEGLTWMLDVLSSYKLSVDKFYASDYAVFKRGGWLRLKYEEHLSKNKQKSGGYKNRSQQANEDFDDLKQLYANEVNKGADNINAGSDRIVGENQKGISRLHKSN